MSTGRVTVVGLGPGDASLVTAGTLEAIARVGTGARTRFVRTERHPSAHLVAGATTFDHHYDAAETFDDVYARIVDDLVAAAAQVAAAGETGGVLYAVPGSPRVLERTVDLLVADPRVDVEVLPAMSFLDLAWVRLGIDPLDDGVRLVDAHRFAERAAGERGPLLVAHVHNERVLSDVKLAFEGEAPERAVVLQRLGTVDERIFDVAWDELDRVVEADHLTSLFLPEGAPPVAAELVRFDDVVHRLRRDCPWDRQQTHRSLTRYLLEESYEVLEAIDHLEDQGPAGYDALEEELGDLLFQVFFHATLAAEEGAFNLADVAKRVSDKLIHRHPHVFAGVEINTEEELVSTWEAMKREEKGRESVMDGIPEALPALLLALKVQKKAAAQDVDWRTLVQPDDGEFALQLLDVVDRARQAGDDPEDVLRRATVRMRDRFRAR